MLAGMQEKQGVGPILRLIELQEEGNIESAETFVCLLQHLMLDTTEAGQSSIYERQ